MKKTLLRINQIIFPYLTGIAFFLIFLEAYKYPGFLAKYIWVDPRTLVIITISSALLAIRNKTSNLSDFLFKLNMIILPVSVVVYFEMQYLEATHFHNYVFSRYHFQAVTFFYIVFLSLALFFIFSLIGQKSYLNKVLIFKLILIPVFVIIFMDGLTDTANIASYRIAYIFSHLGASYDVKMHEQLGVYYDYAKFVKSNTPEDARLLIPPMQGPWYSSGNVGIDRYFLFPRNFISGSYDDPLDLSQADYVLLVWGEWGNDESDFAWPKIPVKAEKIIFFDPVTQNIKEVKGNYDPKLSRINGNWGIIKIGK